MKLKPLNDRVLVKRLESEEKTAGGLYIPDTAKEKPSKGQVVAAGPGKTGENGERVALAVKAGDMQCLTAAPGRRQGYTGSYLPGARGLSSSEAMSSRVTSTRR